jgi:hypothetical protein
MPLNRNSSSPRGGSSRRSAVAGAALRSRSARRRSRRSASGPRCRGSRQPSASAPSAISSSVPRYHRCGGVAMEAAAQVGQLDERGSLPRAARSTSSPDSRSSGGTYCSPRAAYTSSSVGVSSGLPSRSTRPSRNARPRSAAIRRQRLQVRGRARALQQRHGKLLRRTAGPSTTKPSPTRPGNCRRSASAGCTSSQRRPGVALDAFDHGPGRSPGTPNHHNALHDLQAAAQLTGYFHAADAGFAAMNEAGHAGGGVTGVMVAAPAAGAAGERDAGQDGRFRARRRSPSGPRCGRPAPRPPARRGRLRRVPRGVARSSSRPGPARA